MVKVVDQRTQEVIRQMPSPEALEIAKALDKMQGLLIRQKKHSNLNKRVNRPLKSALAQP
ncbi:flagellar protein FlaG [Undibacterium arcticum]